MIITEHFVSEVWENELETSLLRNGIINYFRINGYTVYFKEDNPFELLNENPIFMAKYFTDHYEEEINSNDPDRFRTAYAIKYLAEQLPTTPVTAPICLNYSDNKYSIAKGFKKIVAMALAGQVTHPILIVSKEQLDIMKVETDEQLYSLLSNIDPTAEKFYVRIQEMSGGLGFHYLTRYEEELEWIKPLRVTN